MKTLSTYKIFLHDKSTDEMKFNTHHWVSELDFVALESSFLIYLIKSFPINSLIPNLFEELQEFIRKLKDMEEKKDRIYHNIKTFTNRLSGMKECDKLSCNNTYVISYEKIAKEFFNFRQLYEDLKIQIYQYLTGILD